jgi:hypothetical protein
MWLWLKTKFALLMVAIGIDWPNMADGDKLNAVIGSGIGLIGIGLGVLGYKLTKRQGEIAEAQHRFFQDETSKTTDLRVIVEGMTNTMTSDASVPTTVRFAVHNGGNKSADGFYWELLIPAALSHMIGFFDEDGAVLQSKWSHLSETEHYRKIDGHYTHKLWGYTGVEVARIRFDGKIDVLQEFFVKWRIRGEGGMVPPLGSGLAFIKLKRVADGTYEWSRWHPGQKLDDIQ